MAAEARRPNAAGVGMLRLPGLDVAGALPNYRLFIWAWSLNGDNTGPCIVVQFIVWVSF